MDLQGHFIETHLLKRFKVFYRLVDIALVACESQVLNERINDMLRNALDSVAPVEKSLQESRSVEFADIHSGMTPMAPRDP